MYSIILLKKWSNLKFTFRSSEDSLKPEILFFKISQFGDLFGTMGTFHKADSRVEDESHVIMCMLTTVI